MLVVGLMFVASAFAQGWERTLGGDREDYGEAVTATSDWGALVVGYSESFSSDNDLDVYATRLDVDGQILWSNVYDEAYEERAYDVLETTDGGFLLAGYIINNPGEKANAYLLKLRADGEKEWSVQYGNPDSIETLNSLSPAVDGGYMLAGAVSASEEEARDVLLIKVAEDGQLIWRRTYGDIMDDVGTAVTSYKDGYALTGFTDNPGGQVGKNILLYRLEAGGDTIWTRSIGTSFSEEAEDLLATRDGGLVVAGQATAEALEAYLAKFDENGEEVWSRTISRGVEDLFNGVVELPDGSLVAGGLSSLTEINVDILIAKFTADGEITWLNNQGREETYEAAEGIALTQDGGFLLTGYNGKISGFFNDVVVVKTDRLGNTLSASITGKIFFDRDGSCDEDVNDDPISGWLVRAESPDKVYFGTSNAEGEYEIPVDTGAYTVSVLLPTNIWKTCYSEGREVVFDGLYDSAVLDFPVSVREECPFLEVNVSALTVMSCEEGDYQLDYRNVGTAAAQNVRVEVTLDPALAVKSASAAYEEVDGKLVFALGNLLPFEGGEVRLTVSNCEQGELQPGEAVQVQAEIISDEAPCSTAGPEWDGSSVEVNGFCDQDSVGFTVRNVGDSDMTESSQFGVVEDIVLIRQDSFRLPAGQSIRVFWERATGSTYRIIAEQVKDHPGLQFPTFALEGCTTSEDLSYRTGFVTMFPENDGDLHLSLDVQEVSVGPVVETTMKGHPKGYDADRLISKNTQLDYKVEFHNLGMDTIRRVVIRDTLPPALDVTTIQPGASSHPYEFEVYGENILKITFPDILLTPDGSEGEDGESAGFVNFKLAQKADNPVGTVIENSAAVFLGYQAPVQTNRVFHQVGNFPEFITVNVKNNKTFIPGVKIKVSPNPFIESTVFEIEGKDYKDLTFSLYDLQGKLIRRERHNSAKFEVYRNNLTAGIYFYTIRSREQIINTGKLLVQ